MPASIVVQNDDFPTEETKALLRDLKEICADVTELMKQARQPVIYSETEAATRLGFKNVNTLREIRKKGLITFSCIAGRIRYTPEYLDEFIKKHKIKARR